ncbi:MAG: ribulose-phosphate 3-epimerase [Candidatus ainarchaeum sp.]|nr:ribulose-phosphate 3-epimerase [Candidatus ainarchaeum sp.]MDD5096286.1 ribulose-phosphate 3-epimerase [Candidatus ainarchaeum sp.]
MALEVIPAVLVKTREELLDHISRVSNYVKTIHIDIMDNKFVPNFTIGIKELQDLPSGLKYEIHWMVERPEEWIGKVKGPYLHMVHVEAVESWEKLAEAVKGSGGRLGVALNPETPLEKLKPHLQNAEKILVMSVHPGFYGQKYIPEVEAKVKELRRMLPKAEIEVDGGINPETGMRVASCGADNLAAASSIFAKPDAGKAIGELKEALKKGWGERHG